MNVEWISVTVKKPGRLEMVLMVCPESQRGVIQYGYWNGLEQEWLTRTTLGWEPVSYTGKPVTHWMPLPPPPEGVI